MNRLHSEHARSYKGNAFHLLAKNDKTVSGLRINPIQRPIHRQLGQHNDLLNRQRRITLGPTQLIGKVTG